MGTIALSDAKGNYQQQNQGTTVQKKEKTIFDFLSGDPKIEKAIGAVAGKFFTPDRFLRLAVNAVKKTPLLMYCDPNSVLGAFMTSAALGLEPNTVLQQAFLIPYKKRTKQGDNWVDTYECNFQIGARGFVTLAHRSPQIATLQSEAIHEHDVFEHMLGTESFLKYQKTLKDRGELIGSFCFTKMADGNEMATVLPLDELHKIRSRSETFNALSKALDEASDAKSKAKAQKKLDDTPWVMWQDDMASKSATKKHAKQLPLAPGDGLSVAAQLDADDGKTIDMASMMDPDRVKAVMREGIDGVEDGGSSSEAFGTRAEALEDNPSPTLNTMNVRAQEAETVEATATQSTQQQQQAPAEQPKQQQSAQNEADDRYAKLKRRLETLADLDMLDVEADLITDVTNDPDEQDLLSAIYKQRREELSNPQPQAMPKNRTAARRGMSIE